MKNLIFLSALIAAFTAESALAANPYLRQFRDIKLPTQAMIEKQTITNPIAADADYIENDHAGGASAAAVVDTTITAQPDVPRNLVITPGGTTTDIESCVIVVAGTNYNGGSITESFTFAANATDAVVGAEAFKTVTSVTFPANCESGGFAATWDIGVGEKLGAKRCMASAGHLVFSTVSGAYETTRATVTADADELEKNTFDFNGTMDAAADFEAFFIQNFGGGNCL